MGDTDDAYLGDFGLVRTDGGDTVGEGLTAAGSLVGTVAYLAAEVIRGEPATPAADRYAFAAMAFECLTGAVVFPRGTTAPILFAHTSEPPPAISARRPELPASLDPVFKGALAKDPGHRPASARASVDHAGDPPATETPEK